MVESSSVQPIDGHQYAIFVSYVEVYNDFIFDLLDDQSFDNVNYGRTPQSKHLKRSFDGSYFVHGLEEVEIKSAEEAYELLWKGQQRRRSAHTNLNDSSSRSHSVFTFRVVQAPRHAVEYVLAERRTSDASNYPTFTKQSLCISQLSVVDLAGSERCGRTHNRGDRLKEGSGINSSLMNLRHCIEKLRSNQMNGRNEIVPYNSCKLTSLFKNFFEGIGSVRMIICINPEASEYRENLQVLKFSEMSQEVQVFHTDVTAKVAAQHIPPLPPIQSIQTDSGSSSSVPPPPTRTRHHEIGNGDTKEETKRSSKTKKRIRTRSEASTKREIQFSIPFPLSMDIPSPGEATGPDLMAYQLIRDSIMSRIAKCEEMGQEVNSRFESCRSSTEATYQRYFETKQENSDLKSTIRQRDLEAQAARDMAASLQQQINQLTRDNKRFKDTANQERQRRQLLIQQHRQEMETASTTTSSSSSSSPMLPPFRTGAVPRTAQKPIVGFGRTVTTQATVHSSVKKTVKPAHRTAENIASTMSPLYARTNSNPDCSMLNTAEQTFRNRQPGKLKKPAVFQEAAVKTSNNVANNAPVVAHLRHRRSKSVDRWLEHDTSGLMKLDTVMQPNFSGKKRKSVTELKVEDTKKADKYMLRTQTRDDTGDIAEKLYKGDVVPTAGGGSAVILTEVEELHITSPSGNSGKPPTPAKSQTLSSTPVPSVLSTSNHQCLSPAQVDERCAVGYSGRDGFKK